MTLHFKRKPFPDKKTICSHIIYDVEAFTFNENGRIIYRQRFSNDETFDNLINLPTITENL